MEQQVAGLIRKVMEMSDRLRQSEEAAEQASQFSEAHKSAGEAAATAELFQLVG